MWASFADADRDNLTAIASAFPANEEMEVELPSAAASPAGARDENPVAAASVSLSSVPPLTQLARRVAAGTAKQSLGVGTAVQNLNDFSIFDGIDAADRNEIMRLAKESTGAKRAMGSMVGMAVCDSVGHAFEFLPVCRKGSHFDPETLKIVGDFNQVMRKGFRTEVFEDDDASNGTKQRVYGKFRLHPGQWTDDTSMSLALADSLITRNGYDGSDIRVRFWNWWNNGYCNAFRYDESRSHSVGLGGNISMSLDAITDDHPPPRFDSCGEDAGNGSLMRLAPVPLLFHRDVDVASRMSSESSYTTHPGPIAADACAFLSYLIVEALRRPEGCENTAAQFLDECCAAYLSRPHMAEQPVLQKMLLASEPPGSTERCWNWREPNYEALLKETLTARGRSYNGYPVSAGYFGAYSMDGLAMALNSLYHTTTFMGALARVVNFLGDSDSTGAICGQVAGAFYGVDAIDPRLIQRLQRWDGGGEVALRGVLLFALGEDSSEATMAQASDICLGKFDSGSSQLVDLLKQRAVRGKTSRRKKLGVTSQPKRLAFVNSKRLLRLARHVAQARRSVCAVRKKTRE